MTASAWLQTGAETKPEDRLLRRQHRRCRRCGGGKTGDQIAAVVSRGGRPDLAGRGPLEKVVSPTLLIVGGNDDVVIDLNRQAAALLCCTKEVAIVPGATHLFEEPGTLEQVARQAANWFERWFAA